jgi:hypothetical protein
MSGMKAPQQPISQSAAAHASNKQCTTTARLKLPGERRSEQQSLIVENQRESRESPMLNAF